MNGKFSLKQVVGFFVADRYVYCTKTAETIFNNTNKHMALHNSAWRCVEAIKNKSVIAANDTIIKQLFEPVRNQYQVDKREYIKQVCDVYDAYLNNQLITYNQVAIVLGFLNRARYSRALSSGSQQTSMDNLANITGTIVHGCLVVDSYNQPQFALVIMTPDHRIIRAYTKDLYAVNKVGQTITFTVTDGKIVNKPPYTIIDGRVELIRPAKIKDTSYPGYYRL